METITPIPLIRLKIADVPPGAAPETPPEGFAQVMADQKKFSRPKENPVDLDREGAGPKTTLTPEEKARQEGRDPANDPEVTSFVMTPISNSVLPSSPSPSEEPPAGLEDPTFSLKLEAQTPNPVLAATEPIGVGSRIQPLAEDILITSETGPASASVQPAGTLKENPLLSKAFEDLIRYPTPESLTIEQKVSPQTTEIAIRSSQTTMENSPSFSPQSPAIPETTPIVDGPDPSPSLILREFALPGQESETSAQAIKTDPQAPPLARLSGTEKVAAASIVEGPPIVEAGPVDAHSQAVKFSATVVSPEASQEIPSDRELPLLAKAEGLPDPEKTAPSLTGRDPETSLLPRASSKKVAPGIALQYPGENPAGSGGPEMNNPLRFQEDAPLGVIARFPDQPQIEGVPADRSVEGPPKGSPEWIKEAQSVYHQFSKGLSRTLQQSGERIQMTLDPPQLGNILLEISRDRNFVTAHLWTDNPLTKELLDFSQGQLQKTLALDGFKLDRFEVLVQPDLKSFQEERWFGGRQPGGENTRQGGGRASPEALLLTGPETAPRRFSQGNHYVDTWV